MHMCAAPAFLPAPRSQLFGTFFFVVVVFRRLSQTQKTCAFWYSHQSAAPPQRLVYIWGISLWCVCIRPSASSPVPERRRFFKLGSPRGNDVLMTCGHLSVRPSGQLRWFTACSAVMCCGASSCQGFFWCFFSSSNHCMCVCVCVWVCVSVDPCQGSGLGSEKFSNQFTLVVKSGGGTAPLKAADRLCLLSSSFFSFCLFSVCVYDTYIYPSLAQFFQTLTGLLLCCFCASVGTVISGLSFKVLRFPRTAL